MIAINAWTIHNIKNSLTIAKDSVKEEDKTKRKKKHTNKQKRDENISVAKEKKSTFDYMEDIFETPFLDIIITEFRTE